MNTFKILCTTIFSLECTDLNPRGLPWGIACPVKLIWISNIYEEWLKCFKPHPHNRWRTKWYILKYIALASYHTHHFSFVRYWGEEGAVICWKWRNWRTGRFSKVCQHLKSTKICTIFHTAMFFHTSEAGYKNSNVGGSVDDMPRSMRQANTTTEENIGLPWAWSYQTFFVLRMFCLSWKGPWGVLCFSFFFLFFKIFKT